MKEDNVHPLTVPQRKKAAAALRPEVHQGMLVVSGHGYHVVAAFLLKHHLHFIALIGFSGANAGLVILSLLCSLLSKARSLVTLSSSAGVMGVFGSYSGLGTFFKAY